MAHRESMETFLQWMVNLPKKIKMHFSGQWNYSGIQVEFGEEFSGEKIGNVLKCFKFALKKFHSTWIEFFQPFMSVRDSIWLKTKKLTNLISFAVTLPVIPSAVKHLATACPQCEEDLFVPTWGSAPQLHQPWATSTPLQASAGPAVTLQFALGTYQCSRPQSIPLEWPAPGPLDTCHIHRSAASKEPENLSLTIPSRITALLNTQHLHMFPVKTNRSLFSKA